MKPIIIDMKDMSDSTEVYNSRPNPVLAGFVYLVLVMVVLAFVWMYFCKVDIVVKGNGIVATTEEVATITNQVAGVITERKVEDGQPVKAGDVMYIVSTEEQALQLEVLRRQLADSEEKEEMLAVYKEWLETGEEFPVDIKNNLYYEEVSVRKSLIELGQENAMQTYSGELSAYNVKMDANEELIRYYNEAIEKSGQLIEAVKSRRNTFNSDENYYWNMMENYLAKYQQTVNQYDVKISELQKQSDSAAKEIEELEMRKKKLREQLNAESDNASVSGSDMSAVVSLQKDVNATEAALVEERALKETIDGSIHQTQTQKNMELIVFEKETIAAIESNILGYEQNLALYEGTKQEYAGGQNAVLEHGTENTLENLVAQEIHSVVDEIENGRQQQTQLQGQIAHLEQSIENATVRASADGRVNFVAELVEGDYIGTGTQALTIIPDSETGAFKVRSYVGNGDIAKIEEGMNVTYEIGAYPSREYGAMSGKVTFVSADIKLDDSGSAYYMIETSADVTELRNHLGEEASLKVGMLCQTRIITDEKRVLEILIEKIFRITD